MAKPTNLQSPQNDYESILDTVWKEEQRAALDDRMENALQKDESRARGRKAEKKAAPRKPTPTPERNRSRARSRSPRPRLRPKRESKGDEPGHHVRASIAAGIAAILCASLILAAAGLIFKIVAAMMQHA
jgi:hypothetical protein